jgi:protein SCO1/2
MGLRMKIREVLGLCAIAAVWQGSALAQTDHEHHHAASTDTGPAIVAGLRVPDTVLVNQRGEKVHFYSDLVKGKVVAINTIFTTCTTICPLMGANFAKLRKLLGGNPKISLISISIDPAVDTPERLDQWSREFGPVGAGWTLLTGEPAEVVALLKALQVFTPDKQDHAPVVLIGGDGVGDWSRASALMPASQLAGLILSRAGH